MTDPRIAIVREWFQGARGERISYPGDDTCAALLNRLDAHAVGDAGQLDEQARAMFAKEYAGAHAAMKAEEKRCYSELRYEAAQLEEAFVDGYRAALKTSEP
jgi:hypothetical protein